MVIEQGKKEKELTILDESIFKRVAEDATPNEVGSHVVRFDNDSYIFLFSGRRGGGKTTAMTFYALYSYWLYGMKAIANFPIECMIRRYRPDGQSYLQHFQTEPLDFVRLFQFDEEYQHCLIMIDESADIISHMASQTWKNRLINAFVRQIRKNQNTLFLGAQSSSWIDKSLRWQIDIEVDCQDSSRIVGDNAGLERGEQIWMKFFDDSGIWTGHSTEERLHNLHYYQTAWVMQGALYPRFMWGDDEHKPVYNTWYQLDLLDSLRRVDLRLSKMIVSDNRFDSENESESGLSVSNSTLRTSLTILETLMADNPDNINCYQTDFYESVGNLSKQDKNNLGTILTRYGVERGRDSNTGKRYYDFSHFDLDNFRSYVNSRVKVE